MVPRSVGIAALALWQTVSALNVDLKSKPGQAITPEIVVPGEWMMDHAEHFLFLPLSVPADVPMDQCKIMSNGDSLLVVVTETPQEEPETNALRKYKLVIEAMKVETGHDEALLQTKLHTWFDTEDDDEVKVHIKAAMDSLTTIQKAKKDAEPKTISVSLGLTQNASKTLSKVITVAPSSPSRALPALLRGSAEQHHHHRTARVIKESFAVEVPYPVPVDRIALLKTSPTTLLVAMPLVRKSLGASGISTGGKAFNRVPVFDKDGWWIAGPKQQLGSVNPGLDIAMVVSQAGFEPLSD